MALPADLIAALRASILNAEDSMLAKKDEAELKALAQTLDGEATSAKLTADASRIKELSRVIKGPVL
jgi:regulator of protease activity HflC (stomatin/prohibitin superfamily)